MLTRKQWYYQMVLIGAGLVGISLSFSLQLEWWLSGLVTALLMIGTEQVWRGIMDGQFHPNLDFGSRAILSSLTPIMVCLVGVGWLALNPPTAINIGIGLFLGITSMGWIIITLENESQTPFWRGPYTIRKVGRKMRR